VDHRAHEPGTVADCPECQTLAIEPGWYKAMREDRVTGRPAGSVLLPDADDVPIEVVSEELPRAGVVLPDLEQTRPEEPQ
jgi:hypothetical protein